MDIDVVKDIQGFYRTIGGLDELGERNLLNDDDNGSEHEKYLKELLKKYDFEFEDKEVSGLIEQADYNLELESIINKEFTRMMESDLDE